MDSNFKAGFNILLSLFFLIFDEDNLRVTWEAFEWLWRLLLTQSERSKS